MTDLARLRQLVATTDTAPDADLLDRFITDRDGPAFAALVRRHGPMVLAVCRRVLCHRQNAEDAFQATFLVLARRAEAVRPRSQVGNWLYGVAYRTAHNARRAASVRREREAHAVVNRADKSVHDDVIGTELREALDRELAALPDTYRAAVVACDLEGLPRRDAAVRLGWTEGTLSSRLARARALLARRLARFGLAVPAAGLAAVAGPEAVASTLVEPTVRLGALVAVGEAVVAAPVAALMEGTMKTMLLLKFKALAASAVVGCAVAATALAGWRADEVGTADPTQLAPQKAAEPPKRAAPNSDKERIAELEQERNLLQMKMELLRVRLEQLEAEKKVLKLQVNQMRAAAQTAERAGFNLLDPTSPSPMSGRPNDPNANKPVPPKTVPIPQGPYQTEPEARPPSNVKLPAVGDPFRPGAKAQPENPTLVPTKTTKAAVKTYDVDSLVKDDKEGEALVKVVRAVVEPNSWGTNAGIEYLPSHKMLVVRQTDKVHEEVKELLAELGTRKKPAQNPGPGVRP